MTEGSDDLPETILKTIQEGTKKAESMPSPCIFRVPKKLRKVKKSAYTPQLVSIGPLHSNKEHLKSPMEDIKKQYAEALFKRVQTANPTMDFTLVLKQCVEKMKLSLDRARDCYAEKVEVDVEKMKESLDEARECCAKKVYALEKMKESLDKAKECFAKKVDVLEDVEKMKELLDRAKECFPKKVDALDVPMLVIDGCFILELLCRYHHHTYKPSKPDDEPRNHCYDGCIPFFPHKKPHHTEMIETSNNPNSNNKTSRDFCFDSALTRVAIKHDLLLLENQLPFFVLEDLFHLTVAKIPDLTVDNIPNRTVVTIQNHPSSLRDYLHSYFDNMMNPSEQSQKNDGEQSQKNHREQKICHILHFLHNQYRDPDKQEGRKKQQDCCGSRKTDVNHYDSMPPASELEYAGVKFQSAYSPKKKEKKFQSAEKKSKTGDQHSPFKVQFDVPRGLSRCFCRASFNIPTLRIGAATETLFRNLIAFEQCYTDLDFYFTSYAIVMDRLVDTKNDVAVLEKAKIIRCCLGDREKASDLFNSLCKEIILPRDNFYFAHTCNDATNYSKECWPKFMAQLRRTCFANPWTFIAFLVAFIAFGVSVAQAIRNFLR